MLQVLHLRTSSGHLDEDEYTTLRNKIDNMEHDEKRIQRKGLGDLKNCTSAVTCVLIVCVFCLWLWLFLLFVASSLSYNGYVASQGFGVFGDGIGSSDEEEEKPKKKKPKKDLKPAANEDDEEEDDDDGTASIKTAAGSAAIMKEIAKINKAEDKDLVHMAVSYTTKLNSLAMQMLRQHDELKGSMYGTKQKLATHKKLADDVSAKSDILCAMYKNKNQKMEKVRKFLLDIVNSIKHWKKSISDTAAVLKMDSASTKAY